MTSLPKHCILVTAIAALMSFNLAYGDDQRESEPTDANQEIVDALKQIRQILEGFKVLDADEQQHQDKSEATTGELTRPFVDAITMLGIRENGSRYIVARPQLVLESVDPERGGKLDRQITGTVWVWGDGRPVALTEVWRFKDQGLWGHTLISTTPGLVAARAEGIEWKPEQPGLQFARFPRPIVPAETIEDRTRQMTQLISQFTGYEMVRRNVVPLRMFPEPLHRYKEEGIVDGALFAIGHNGSPYGYLFVEAVSDPIEPSYWRYAWAKGTSSPVTIELGGNELLHIPGSLNFQGSAREPFWVYFRQLPSE